MSTENLSYKFINDWHDQSPLQLYRSMHETPMILGLFTFLDFFVRRFNLRLSSHDYDRATDVLDTIALRFWHIRAHARFYGANKCYEPIQVDGFTDRFPLHFLHISTDNPGMVAYTPDDQYGKADRQVRQKFGKYFGMMVLVSTVGHIAFILGMPAISADISVQQDTSMEAVDLPPEVVIPPPPQPLAKPSIPQMAEEEIDEDITIDETTPPPPDLIPEMPVAQAEDRGEEFLMVAEVMPKFKSVPPQPKMPSYIARARVDVTTVIEFFVTKSGDVDSQRTAIVTSSGYPELDEIAVDWAKKIKFHPALNRGEPVAVRVRIDIQWKTK